jgi:hypothetical protein
MDPLAGPAPTSKERLATQVFGVTGDPRWRATAASTSSAADVVPQQQLKPGLLLVGQERNARDVTDYTC